jgi:hypothetical protein
MRRGAMMKARVRKKRNVGKKQKPNVVTLDSLFARNPHLDRERIQRRMELRPTGKIRAKRRGYTLGAPYTQRRVSVTRDASDRTVLLRAMMP